MARIMQTGEMYNVTMFPTPAGTTAEQHDLYARAVLPQLPNRQDGLRRRWPQLTGPASYQMLSTFGGPSIWVRQDVLAFAMIALGPDRIETIVAAMPVEAAQDDHWVTLPGSEMIRDRSAAFIRMADLLFPPGQSRQPVQRLVRQLPNRSAAEKLSHDPAYDLSDLDDESLAQTYRMFCRRPEHPVTLACLRELARRQSHAC